ncbi:MAG: GTPase Era [Myxococcota bacterium]
MSEEDDMQSEPQTNNEDFHAGFVALIGQPNVGKSTIMNRILGVDLAIATSKPQTTRNRILGVRTFPEKGQLCFLDTPGIHKAEKKLNRAMVATALEAMKEVDLVCHVVDAADFLERSERVPAGELPRREEFIFRQLDELDVPVLLVLNKVDLVSPKEKLLPMIDQLTERREFVAIVPTSATKGANMRELVDELLEQLPAGPPLFPEDMLTDKAERFVAAEFIREQVMRQTREEIPYSVAIEIERFIENDEKNLLEVSAVIHVERDSQKGIIIGKGGSRLKEIGREARQRMQEFFHRKVFLETFVRVESEWSDSPDALERFGYK